MLACTCFMVNIDALADNFDEILVMKLGRGDRFWCQTLRLRLDSRQVTAFVRQPLCSFTGQANVSHVPDRIRKMIGLLEGCKCDARDNGRKVKCACNCLLAIFIFTSRLPYLTFVSQNSCLEHSPVTPSSMP